MHYDSMQLSSTTTPYNQQWHLRFYANKQEPHLQIQTAKKRIDVGHSISCPSSHEYEVPGPYLALQGSETPEIQGKNPLRFPRTCSTSPHPTAVCNTLKAAVWLLNRICQSAGGMHEDLGLNDANLQDFNVAIIELATNQARLIPTILAPNSGYRYKQTFRAN